MADDPAATTAGGEEETKKNRERGLVKRVWKGIFGGKEDLEKKLQFLSKEEASVRARIKRRARSSQKLARNVVALSVFLEGLAVTFAIMSTRSPDLIWEMRAMRVAPMFALPVLATTAYYILMSLTKMFDEKDKSTLERLREERQARIDELKERTNYYNTQQLIQRYDLDPAAKAAAATILASKIGADSGLRVQLGDESINPVQLTDEISNHGDDGDEVQETGKERIVENSGGNVGGWIAKLAALLVGEDPTQCYAIICSNCHMHNGLARKEDYAFITYYCPHCHALNGPHQSVEHETRVQSGEVTTPLSNDASKSSSSDGSPVVRNTVADREITENGVDNDDVIAST